VQERTSSEIRGGFRSLEVPLAEVTVLPSDGNTTPSAHEIYCREVYGDRLRRRQKKERLAAAVSQTSLVQIKANDA
jgi:hypothetical protein